MRSDPRREFLGLDRRRSDWSAEDVARLDGLIALHGGTVEVVRSGDAAISLRWVADTGQTVCVSAPSGPGAVTALASAITGRAH